MKATIVLALMFAAVIFLTGCSHYGMDQHYNDHWHSHAISGPHNMNENSMQSTATYGR